ncbi:hypothetical protein F3P66_25395 (plasmid) [Agrobacterium fabrum]|uniref:Uncharacterized protein n=1 Tax=Agrobacterium fabrum (strain C58 / ATCC 33970) TaxID=176299 RepID=Q8UKL3_AGRFC|nr:conserved hypothetical protein [Agrobacterium fabrum str. C58]QRM62703.1 hypothetical protein F3P66_25395 [Agrobacterium fabrum]TRB28165.1 hypothetical protein EXN51_16085 [Agrobacterium fabrum]
MFTAGIAARTTRHVLWCLTRTDLFAPALAQVRLDPNRVGFVAGNGVGRDFWQIRIRDLTPEKTTPDNRQIAGPPVVI